jgi:hypothetical protein
MPVFVVDEAERYLHGFPWHNRGLGGNKGCFDVRVSRDGQERGKAERPDGEEAGDFHKAEDGRGRFEA